MTERIKALRLSEWAAVLGVAALLLILPGVFAEPDSSGPDPNITPGFFSPWPVAEAVETEIAIMEFNGTEVETPSWRKRATALGAILLYYVIGPGLFILCGTGAPKETLARETLARETLARETLTGKASEESSPAGGWRRRFFQVGMALVIAGLANLGTLVVLPRLAYQQARASNANQMAEDRLVREAHAMARSAYQYHALPDSLGGGEGSFEGIVSEKSLKRSDSTRSYRLSSRPFGDAFSGRETRLLPVGKKSRGARLARHRLQIESDTLLKIISTREKPRPDLEDSDQKEVDSIRVVTTVVPSDPVSIEVSDR